MTKIKGKVVWITGASSGIGEELAYQFAQKGATLILSARREDKLNAVRDRCRIDYNAQAVVYPLDMTDLEAIDQAASYLVSKFKQIDILINNAGFGHTQSFLDYDIKKAESMFQVNVLGLMYLSQLVGKNMRKYKDGHIVNVASVAGKVATPKSAVYSASKFAVTGFTNALRMELAPHNIKVTAINPGPVDTAFFNEFDPSGEYLDNVSSVVLSSEYVVKKTIKAIEKNKREINLPTALAIGSKIHALLPALGDFIIRTSFDKK